MELGGPVTISSTQTGYHAKIEFHTKPFFGGDKNKVSPQTIQSSVDFKRIEDGK